MLLYRFAYWVELSDHLKQSGAVSSLHCIVVRYIDCTELYSCNGDVWKESAEDRVEVGAS